MPKTGRIPKQVRLRPGVGRGQPIRQAQGPNSRAYVGLGPEVGVEGRLEPRRRQPGRHVAGEQRRLDDAGRQVLLACFSAERRVGGKRDARQRFERQPPIVNNGSARRVEAARVVGREAPPRVSRIVTGRADLVRVDRREALPL